MPNIAKKSDWKTKAMPKKHRIIPLGINFSQDEYSALQKGFVPCQMEDKWFVYFQGNNLYCHRSWTGFCVYIGKFKIIEGKPYLHEVQINENKKQYKTQSDFFEIRQFFKIINCTIHFKKHYIISPVIVNNSIESFEKDYCNLYSNLSFDMDLHYDKLLEEHKLKLNSNEITKAIILRLKTYYETQDGLAKFLNKKSVAPASDFFVETVLFYLKVFLEQRKKNLKIASEKKVKLSNGYIKPDISVWKDDKVVAIIECKTNLGFSRNKWESNFKSRTKKLKKAYPNANAFLLVLSSKNWSGFDKKDKKTGKKYFALSNTSLRKIEDTPLDKVVENRIEKLFGQILELA